MTKTKRTEGEKMARSIYGKVVKVLVDDQTTRKRKVMKGFEDVDGNVYFVSPVVRVDGRTYEISPKPNRRGYHVIVKPFRGSRVKSRF
jgi:hypothetical protein